MRTLDDQQRVLDTLDAYLDELKARKDDADQIDTLRAAQPNLPIPAFDFTATAWANVQNAGRLPPSRAAIPFSPRKDGTGQAVPSVTLKVPTGGGKTWLAVNAVRRIMGRYLSKNTGFVLWIVPNEAICTPTLKRLKGRQHPCRQALDRAAAGRVKIMGKFRPAGSAGASALTSSSRRVAMRAQVAPLSWKPRATTCKTPTQITSGTS